MCYIYMAFVASKFISSPHSAQTSRKSNIFSYWELSKNEKNL